ncbi:MAG: 4-(cytidine 5'-diphospho)-2-C-methyl-D-erythritol kinase [Pseudomonadota bacterium]
MLQRAADAPLAPLQEAARAKINLALHIVGRRDDGYHLLDSLVAFAEPPAADKVTVSFGAPADERLTITGPFGAGLPTDSGNVVVKAADAVGGVSHVRLEKALPVAAGIGGGSADAAAVLRAAARRDGVDPHTHLDTALHLGADVPVCLLGQACRMSGIGEVIEPVAMPRTPIVLINPRLGVPTGAVFDGLPSRHNAPLDAPPSFGSVDDLARWLSAQRNDMASAAEALVPDIRAVVEAVAGTDGCLLARMSGSGATVFGLFRTDEEAARAAATITKATSWWGLATHLPQHRPSAPAA